MQALTDGVALVFEGIGRLHDAFRGRALTIDGRLVGNIGEVIAALESRRKASAETCCLSPSRNCGYLRLGVNATERVPKRKS